MLALVISAGLTIASERPVRGSQNFSKILSILGNQPGPRALHLSNPEVVGGS